jgi:hypothetical protein
MVQQSYKSYLRECIRKLEDTERQRPLTNREEESLQEHYDNLDCHLTYLNESGQAYENQF